MAPVHEAASKNDVKKLRALLEADPDLVDEEDEEYEEDEDWDGRRWTPLAYACDAGSLEAAQLLIEEGANIEEVFNGVYTPLMIACLRGHAGVVSLLLDEGADPTMHWDFSSPNILMETAGEGTGPGSIFGMPGSDFPAVLRLLIEDGRVPVDLRDSCGWTALYHACHSGYSDRARVLLLDGRADHTIRSRSGVTPKVAAQRRGHEDCVRLLEWYEGELEKAYLLSKARAVADARECISKAAEKVGARTEAEAQRAREEAAPAYLRGRVSRGEALPMVGLEGQAGKRGHGEEEEEECGAVCEFLVHGLKDDLVVEMMQGLRYR